MLQDMHRLFIASVYSLDLVDGTSLVMCPNTQNVMKDYQFKFGHNKDSQTSMTQAMRYLSKDSTFPPTKNARPQRGHPSECNARYAHTPTTANPRWATPKTTRCLRAWPRTCTASPRATNAAEPYGRTQARDDVARMQRAMRMHAQHHGLDDARLDDFRSSDGPTMRDFGTR